jgi:hypothetical protein
MEMDEGKKERKKVEAVPQNWDFVRIGGKKKVKKKVGKVSEMMHIPCTSLFDIPGHRTPFRMTRD